MRRNRVAVVIQRLTLSHLYVAPPRQVLLAAVDDAFAASFWGLYSASPLARFTRLEAGFPGIEGGHVTCETVVKTCGDWNTLVLFRCPVPEPFMDAYHAAAATNGGAVQTFTLSLESSPSRGLAALPVCMWEQKPARSDDATERTAAVCVRPFRPFFFGTTTPSISEEQVTPPPLARLRPTLTPFF